MNGQLTRRHLEEAATAPLPDVLDAVDSPLIVEDDIEDGEEPASLVSAVEWLYPDLGDLDLHGIPSSEPCVHRCCIWNDGKRV